MTCVEFAPNTVFANRFTIEELAGRGGMGVVYRARDRTRDGATVALKVLKPFGDPRHLLQRFLREAYVLSELRHPGIVAYVDHGVAPEGLPFLVMEWLEGESLDQRLHRGALSLVEIGDLFRHVAAALSPAHRRGFVHRDLKPENIFLRDGRLDAPVLLDFGVARVVASELTASGIAIGTVLYMAPEQARGDQDVGPGADVFALGCVMYKCLTGRTPVTNGHLAVVLAKVLLDEVPGPRMLRPALPERLDRLVQRMLAKEPAQRPKDASALLEEIDALGPLSDEPASADTQAEFSVAPLSEEQQLVSVILVVEGPMNDSGPNQRAHRQALGDTLRGRFAACVEILLNGSMVVAMAQTEHMTATDQAVHAARCALFLRAHLDSSSCNPRIVMTTGRCIVRGEHLPSGEALDRANLLLGGSTGFVGTESNDNSRDIWLDDTTAHLLDARFQVSRMDSGFFALDSELSIDEARPLLGRPTPCVGRDHELTQLQWLLDECCEESVARLAVVIAAPGIGKSRLRHEFVRRVQHAPGVDVWVGRTDPTRAGTPYGLLADALRYLVDVRDGEELSVQQRKLSERVRRHVPACEAQFVTEFLGELCEIPFSSETSPKLQQARTNPRTMLAHVTAAFVSFLRAECSVHPVLMILEDLHWGDWLTIRVIDASLRDAHDVPLMVLALARPEVEDLFPKFWTARQRQNLHLNGLSKRASALLVTQVLGPDTPPEVVTQIVEQAAGNALFLEELIRFVAEEQSDVMPHTVLAMLQARLQRLEPELRRTLRAASVYGGTFWRGGVLALLGRHVSGANVDERLEELVHRELITKNDTSRFLGDSEYTFRHALVREAAHGLLTDSDLKTGHCAAAAFLQSMGEHDPRVLAEHCALGGEMDRAITLYERAAWEAYRHADLGAVTRLVECGIACGAKGELRGRLRSTQGQVLILACDYVKGYECVSEALALLRRGSADWCYAAGTVVWAKGRVSGYDDEVLQWSKTLRAIEPEPAAIGTYVDALRVLTRSLTVWGRRAQVQTCLTRMGEVIRDAPAPTWGTSDNLFAQGAWMLAQAQADWELFRDPWSAAMAVARVEAIFETIHDRCHLPYVRLQLGRVLAHLGDLDAGEQKLRTACAEAREGRDRYTSSVATSQLAMVLVDKEDALSIEEAHELLRSFLDDDREGDERSKGFANAVLAHLLLGRGELDSAERHARQALDMMRTFIVFHPYAEAALITILRRSDRIREAREYAEAALTRLDRRGGGGFAEVRLKLAAFEAYAAAEDPSAADVLEGAIEQVWVRAEAIPDPEARTRFLEKNEINRRTLYEAHASYIRGGRDAERAVSEGTR